MTIFDKLYNEILKGSLYFDFPTTKEEDTLLEDAGFLVETTGVEDEQGKPIKFISYANAFPNGIPDDVQSFINGTNPHLGNYNMAQAIYAWAKYYSKR